MGNQSEAEEALEDLESETSGESNNSSDNPTELADEDGKIVKLDESDDADKVEK